MTITEYSQLKHPQFTDMLVAYFAEMKSDMPEHIIRGKLLNLIHSEQAQSIIHIGLYLDNDKPIGFTIYQIDTPESDWCKRPGWGFIREFYISPEYRLMGYGRQLASYSETKLRGLGATQIYLTAMVSIRFWEHCGFINTNTFCSNDQFVMVKE
ncbi:MAG: GNAT family N-acetyltransferase [Oscillospiraceae bacterium]|nr:GNAT family N-acetyltransferase [Oscillospiraceae bacterium]